MLRAEIAPAVEEEKAEEQMRELKEAAKSKHKHIHQAVHAETVFQPLETIISLPLLEQSSKIIQMLHEALHDNNNIIEYQLANDLVYEQIYDTEKSNLNNNYMPQAIYGKFEGELNLLEVFNPINYTNSYPNISISMQIKNGQILPQESKSKNAVSESDEEIMDILSKNKSEDEDNNDNDVAESYADILKGRGVKYHESRIRSTRNEEAAKTNIEAFLRMAAKEARIKILLKCIEYGANVNAKDSNGNTALHLAAREGILVTAEVLIKNAAELNEVNNEGKTPLHLAVEMGHVHVIEKLLESGARISIRDMNGNTPYDIALARAQLQAYRSLVQEKSKRESLKIIPNKKIVDLFAIEDKSAIGA